MITAFVWSIFEQSDEEATWSKLGEVIDKPTSAGFNDWPSISSTPLTTSWPPTST